MYRQQEINTLKTVHKQQAGIMAIDFLLVCLPRRIATYAGAHDVVHAKKSKRGGKVGFQRDSARSKHLWTNGV